MTNSINANFLKYFAFLIFLMISILIISTWFGDGVIYGGAEIGLFTHNPQKWLEMSKYIWWDAVAPGQLIPHFVAGVPLYFCFYLLSLIGLSSQHIQQLFFSILLFLMGYGMFRLASDLFEFERKKYSLISLICGLFYMFNVYTLVSVWHRFLYSTLILAAVLPFLILFWRRWTKNGNISDLNIFLVINILASYMYGNLAAVFVIWISILLLSLTKILIPWQGKKYALRILSRFLLGFLLWIIINIWWIAPTFSVAPALITKQHGSEDGLGTLVSISKQSIVPYLLQFVNPYYLFFKQELGEIYSNFFFKLIPWVVSATLFFGLIKSLKMRNFARYSIIFIVVMLLSKGASSPFSYPYIFGFERFYILGILRNPFEKLGIMLPLFGAILFAIGLETLFKITSSYFGKPAGKIIVVFILFFMVIFAWPMLGGGIFGSKQYPAKVKIPSAYLEADEWLKQQRIDEGVILHLPFSGKDVLTYNWDLGYHGVDQNEILFTALPSLSKNVGVKRIDDTLGSLTYIFHSQSEKEKQKILNILQIFNVRFIVLHKDIKWEDKDTYGEKGNLLQPDLIEKNLANLDFLKKEYQAEPLIIYKVSDEFYQPAIKITNEVQIVYPGETNILQILFETSDKETIITPILEKIENSFKPGQTLIFPGREVEYFESSPSATLARANESFLKMGQLKSYFYSIGYLQSEKLTQDMISVTQNIMQLYQGTLQNKALEGNQVDTYERLLKSVIERYSKNTAIRQIFDLDFSNLIKLHILILKQLGISNIADWTYEEMIKMDLMPKYKSFPQVYKFTIPQAGLYDLMTDSPEKDIVINGENIVSKKSIIFNEENYEISLKNKTNIVLKNETSQNATDSNSLLQSKESIPLSYKKESPVSYGGKINLASPKFLIFAQGFHPGWQLSLIQAGYKEQVNKHFMSNLFGNAWWIDKIGEYDFKIEFVHQELVNKGVIISLLSALILISLNIFIIFKKLIRK